MSKPYIFISPFFYPERISSAKYNTELIQELSKHVLNLEVLTYHPFFPDWIIQETKETLDGVKTVRGGRFIKFTQHQMIQRFILECSFALFTIWNSFRLIKAKKIIHVIPPSLFGFLIALFFGKKTICIVHDLQGIYLSQKSGGKVIGSLIKLLEHLIYSR